MRHNKYRTMPLSNKKAVILRLFDCFTGLFVKSKPTKAKKILIIRNDKIGDLVLTTPVFREIKKYLPESSITAVVSSSNKAIIEKNKNINNIITIGMPKRSLSSFYDYIKFYKKIKMENFDIGFDLRGSRMNSFFLLFLPGIRERVSFCNFHKLSLFLTKNIFLEDFYNRHLTLENLEIVNKGLGINSRDNTPEIATDSNDEKNADSFIKKNKLKKYICICPGASHRAKQWPIEKFDILIKGIIKKYPKYKILLIGGGEDRPVIDYLAKNEKCISLVDANLREVYLLFKKSSLIITHEGGTMHIAGVSNTKLIVLVGYTYPVMKHQKPLGKNLIILYHKIKNYGVKDVKKCNDLENNHCIDMITVKEVEKAIKKMLILKS